MYNRLAGLALIAVVAGSIIPKPAAAYWDKTNYTEAVYVQPNQSAFWIPDTGANASNQVQFGSIDYYAANKVAAKRFEIPHSKLVNSGGWSDYYVPAGRLIVVDRTPFNRAWTASATSGTSKANQAMHFESADSMNISVDILANAFVTEEDAAKFLYWFGVKNVPNFDPAHPEAQFVSVIYSQSLAEVMDTVVYAAIQAALAEQFAQDPLRIGITKKTVYMQAAFAKVRDEFKSKGITISTIGYDSGLNFDPEVQKALNEWFAAQVKAQELTALQPVIPIMQDQVNMQAKLAMINKWNGAVPSMSGLYVIPSGFWDGVLNFFAAKTTGVASK